MRVYFVVCKIMSDWKWKNQRRERRREASNSFSLAHRAALKCSVCICVCNNKKKRRRRRREKGDRQQATPTEHTGTTPKSTHRYITHTYIHLLRHTTFFYVFFFFFLAWATSTHEKLRLCVCCIYVWPFSLVSFGSFRCIQHLRFKTYLSALLSAVTLSPLVVELPGDEDIPPHIPAPAPRQWRGSHRALIRTIRTVHVFSFLSLDCCVYRSSSVWKNR